MCEICLQSPCRPRCPCKNCPKRHLGCHSTCSDYKARKYEHDRLKALERQRKEKMDELGWRSNYLTLKNEMKAKEDGNVDKIR